jgi:Lon-like protease
VSQIASWIVTLVVTLTVLALISLWLYPVNSYILLPGQALPVEQMIAIPGHPALKQAGPLYLTDVSLYKADHLLEQVIVAHVNAGADIEPAQNVLGGLPEKQFTLYNQQLMSDSVHQAEMTALSVVPGYHVHFASTGPKIVLVLPGTPASRVLRTGDVVEFVNGRRVHQAAQIAPIVHKLKPGAAAHLVILRRHRLTRIDVLTVPSKNGQLTKHGKTPLIGISMVDQYVIPIKMTVNPGDIGGPSAGLMFTLGIVERLEHRDLARGCSVAGTGTITYPGIVGEIGGAKQKIIAARNSGAKYFLVPDFPDNVQPALANRDGIKILPVKTLRQALSDLDHLSPCH